MAISDVITARLKEQNKRYWAGDNIADYIHEGEKEQLIDELTEKFEGVLDSPIIDRDSDPTAWTQVVNLVKMYNERTNGWTL